MGDTVYVSISAYSELHQQCLFCQSRQPSPQPHHINKGVGSSLCEKLSWPISCAAHTGIYRSVWAGKLNSASYFYFFFWLNSVKEEPGWSWDSIKSKQAALEWKFLLTKLSKKRVHTYYPTSRQCVKYSPEHFTYTAVRVHMSNADACEAVK